MAPTAPPSDAEALTVTGTFNGEAQLEGGCLWLTDGTGQQWEILWPDGYRGGFQDGEPVLISGGALVARGGAMLTVRGTLPTDIGSFCLAGTILRADTLRVANPSPG